jgi:hypothetical protein
VRRVTEMYAEFSDQNMLLHVLLGLAGYLERVHELLPEAPESAEAARVDVSQIDAYVALLLGVVSLRTSLAEEVVAAEGRAVESAGAKSGEREMVALGGLLR